MRTMIKLLLSSMLVGWCFISQVAAESLEAEGVLTLLEEIRVPARDAGVLREVNCQAGSNVRRETTLASLDDTEAKLTKEQAAIELSNARRLAKNDLKVRLASKSHQVATAELKRAIEAAERYSKSVSQTEIDRLTLATEHADLEIYQARFDLKTAQVAIDSYAAALRMAEYQLSKRVILAPTSGVVVEVLKHAGEWVEPGETVMRIVRTDRLRVEGLLPGQHATSTLVGKPAAVRVRLHENKDVELQGEVTFVSPEIHPVSGMVRVRVEIENGDSLLRPGLPATITVEP